MNSYHFSAGNSTDGHVGLCARITANTKEEAVEILKEVLPEAVPVRICDADGNLDDRVEYVQIYTNTKAFTVADIDDADPFDDAPEAEEVEEEEEVDP